MATSGAPALTATRPLHVADVSRSLISARHRLRSAVAQFGYRLEALAWGDARLSLPSAIPAPDGSTVPAASGSVDERRRAQVARIAGPVPDGAHPAPVSPVPHDKRSVIAHYRAMAEQVARERQVSGGASHTLGRWL